MNNKNHNVLDAALNSDRKNVSLAIASHERLVKEHQSFYSSIQCSARGIPSALHVHMKWCIIFGRSNVMKCCKSCCSPLLFFAIVYWLLVQALKSIGEPHELFRILRYMQLKTIFHGPALRSFTFAYFELPLFRTILFFPWKFEIAGFTELLNCLYLENIRNVVWISLLVIQMARSADVIRPRTHGDDAKACDKNAGSRYCEEIYLSLFCCIFMKTLSPCLNLSDKSLEFSIFNRNKPNWSCFKVDARSTPQSCLLIANWSASCQLGFLSLLCLVDIFVASLWTSLV